VERVAILFHYVEGAGITEMQNALGVNRPTIYRCIDKALAAGVASGLKDHYHRAKEPVITDDAKAWVVNLACTKPKEYQLTPGTYLVNILLNRYTRFCPAELG
jgi:hypothetical protein